MLVTSSAPLCLNLGTVAPFFLVRFDVDGVRRDIQLKGSGPTPFSRDGDGRAALGPILREYIISETMFALGIPTTRSLAVIETGETVRRETLLPGAVLTRVASSHIRIGTFQFFAARRDVEAVRDLANYVIARHYPEAADAANPYCALLELVIARQAELVAKWQLVAFIHGVMNTDNMSIAGETIDYGPCAFMDAYDTLQRSIAPSTASAVMLTATSHASPFGTWPASPRRSCLSLLRIRNQPLKRQMERSAHSLANSRRPMPRASVANLACFKTTRATSPWRRISSSAWPAMGRISH
jgi:protein adenylyltransferase SelO-like protein